MFQYFVPTEIGELGVRKPAHEPDQEIQFRRYGRMGCVIGVQNRWDDPPKDVSLVEEGFNVAEYVCEECGDEFDSQQGLASHSRVHS